MSNPRTIGRVHSIQSMGTVDGPGIRFVVFLQGCPLRCGCCHNPDTWDVAGGTPYEPAELAERAERYRTYFGKTGGITVSGGEPLLQANFVRELFSLCHKKGISTCLDTSGCLLTSDVEELLAVTDRILLDVKYLSDELYRQHVGCSLEAPLRFLAYADRMGIPTTLRQVIIPTLNDGEKSVLSLRRLADAHPCVDKVELLPFRKICQVKYDSMGITFPLGHLPEPSREVMDGLRKLLDGLAEAY